MWLHYFGPHSIHYGDLDYAENDRLHVDTYSQKATRTDDAIGRLLHFLDESDLADDTLVILHSDHGESLGEHGFIGHGRYLYEDNLRVPLIMRWPSSLPSGKTLAIARTCAQKASCESRTPLGAPVVPEV